MFFQNFLDFLVYFALITTIPIPSYTHPEKLSEEKFKTGNENYEHFCSLKVNGLATWTKHENDRLSIVDR